MADRSASLAASDLPPAMRGVFVLSVALFALALGVRVAGIAREGFWIDEAYAAMVAEGSPLALLERMRAMQDVHGPLFYLMLDLWMGIVGRGDLVLRLPSALLGAIAAPAAAAIARGTGARTGALAGVFAAVSPVLVREAQEVRMGSLLTLEVALALVAIARRRTWGISVATAAIVLTHASGILYAAALGASVVLLPDARSRVRRAIPFLAGAIPAVAILSVTARPADVAGFLSWNRTRDLPVQLARLAPYLLVGDGARGHAVQRPLQALACAGGALCVGSLLREGKGRRGASLALFACAAVGGAATAYLLGYPSFLPRFFAPLAIPVIVLMASGASSRMPSIAAGLVLVAMGAASVAQLRVEHHPDVRGAAARLEQELLPGGTLLHHASGALAQESCLVARFYLPGYRHCFVAPRGPAVSPAARGYAAGTCTMGAFPLTGDHLFVMVAGLSPPGEPPGPMPSIQPLARDLPGAWRIVRVARFHLVALVEVAPPVGFEVIDR